jgi:tryptophanyl-tRNA synthetase
MTQWKVFNSLECELIKAKLEQVQSKGLISRPEKEDDVFGGSQLGLFAYPVLQAADILLYKYTLLLFG